MRLPSATAVIWLAFAAGVAGWFWYAKYQTPCRRTLHYAIGQFDTQFGESQADFLAAAGSAEAVWEEPTGFDLFEYDPKASFTLNLIFDERQQLTNDQRQLETEISSDTAGFDEQKKLYDTQRTQYDTRSKALKTEIDHYNSTGGAPQDIYSRLEKERNNLNTLADQLNTLADRLSVKAQTLNIKIGSFNTHVGHIFDQANYTGTAINLYEFQNQQDMVLALAHEFGHALQIEHVSNPKAIMYYLLQDQNVDNPTLTTDDLDALKVQCTANYIPRWPTRAVTN